MTKINGGEAVLEGVTFNLRVILDAFEEQGAVVRDVRVIGRSEIQAVEANHG